ncbi:MAG: hypothetical protein AAGA54_29665 [Myxococcota bacterium]
MRTLSIVVAAAGALVPGCSLPGGETTLHATQPDCPSAVYTLAADGRPGHVRLGSESSLRVSVEGASVAMAGKMQGDGAFVPSFPLTPGVRYEVRGARCSDTIEVPPSVGEAQPEVVAVYPRSEALPENILRFYVYFSEPMAEGGFLEHVRLEHVGSGQDLTGVFFDNVHELWSRDRRRITLLVDPGRVKTGLVAHQKLGRAFSAGETYRLTILDTWTSIGGRRLEGAYTAEFTATREDRASVLPSSWSLQEGRDAARPSLAADFGDVVDHVSVHRLLTVHTARGHRVPGRWSIEAGDTSATWVARDEASPEALCLGVDPRFEDAAGNNLEAALDAPGQTGGATRAQLELMPVPRGSTHTCTAPPSVR